MGLSKIDKRGRTDWLEIQLVLKQVSSQILVKCTIEQFVSTLPMTKDRHVTKTRTHAGNELTIEGTENSGSGRK